MFEDYTVAKDRAVYVPFFEELERLIAERNSGDGFETEFQDTRHDVTADEFMYMCHRKDGKEVQFKHSNTRNYIYLRRNVPDSPWQLFVPPVSNTPFNRGQFDA